MTYTPDEEFTLELAYKQLEAFEEELKQICPSPNEVRLLELGKEYSTSELRGLLQTFGSYLSSLHAKEAKLATECNMLKKALKTGMSMAMIDQQPAGSTLVEKEAFMLANNEQFRYAKKQQIRNEMFLDLVHGWVKSYEAAYAAVSRVAAIEQSEMSISSSNNSP